MMRISKKVYALLLVCWLLVVLAFTTYFYRSHYHEEKQRADEAVRLAKQRQQTIAAMQAEQQSVAAIDKKYTQELADAKQTIADLQRDVAAGNKRLRINATCKRVPGATSASGMADAAGARLTADAEQNYFRLREQIATAEKQIAGLQDYIRTIQK